jgi:hypothetical protein
MEIRITISSKKDVVFNPDGALMGDFVAAAGHRPHDHPRGLSVVDGAIRRTCALPASLPVISCATALRGSAPLRLRDG